MKTFLALYRGGTVASAELVAVTADPEIIAQVSNRLLGEDGPSADPVVDSLAQGRRSALQVVHREAVDDLRRKGRFSVVPADDAATPQDKGRENRRGQTHPRDLVDDLEPGGDA